MIDYKLKRNENLIDAYSSLWDIVGFLRDPKDGCPWDKEQTPDTVIRNLQGEVYEYIDALCEGDKEHQKEELGDIYLSLFLLTKIHDQTGDFKASDSLYDACEKYIRRHPHVFSDTKVNNSEQVLANWQTIKREVEGRKEESFFSSVEKSAPELERCYKISKKAAKAGFEWQNIDGVYDKVQEEFEEVKQATTPQDKEEELGDLLFTVVNLCRWYKIKPQDALKKANYKFIKRFEYVVSQAKEDGYTEEEFEKFTPEKWDLYWNKAKENTKA